MDLDTAQKDCRIASSDLFRVKNAYEESVLQLDEVRKENKSLSNEIKDIMDQISEGGRSIHEIDSRIAEKEEEFLGTKKNMTKGLDAMQNALETESKGKAEATRMKKKLEADVAELEMNLEHANATNLETTKAVKKYQTQIRDVQGKLETEQRDKEVARDQLLAADRKAHAMQNQLDEAETNALKGGKKAMNKMETRIRELESELDAEGRRFADGQKNLRKSERRIKELTYASDEDRKNHERMQSLIDQLQGKIKSYKKQLEEAEEIAAMNLAKFRKVQGNLQEASHVCEVNEQALAKARARGRSTSIGPQ